MRYRHGRLLKKDNVIVFPGALDGLIEKGLDAVEDVEYSEAVAAFEQAYHFDPENVRLLAPYAVSLYETKNFEKAKEIATKLLHSGTTDYLDAMELYLAISIQLQDYEEVEMTIDALLEEEIVPPDMVKKFNYLRDLNKRLSKRYVLDDEEPIVIHELFTIEEFMGKTTGMQQQMLAAFENSKLDTSILRVLATIAQKDELHPLVVTYALVLLCKANYEEKLKVKKFGLVKHVVPSELDLPSQDDRSIEVVIRIGALYEKDPSRMQMAIDASLRYGIIAYPFNWDGFSIDDVANAYMQYIESMFSGEPMSDTDLNSLIKYIDEQTER